MHLLSDFDGNQQLIQLDVDQYTDEALAQKIAEFKPDVIYAVSDDENPVVLQYALEHCCHMGFFKPYKGQLNEDLLQIAVDSQLAKLFFLDQDHSEQHYFAKFGRVFHKNYLEECNCLLNFIFYIDTDEFSLIHKS